MSTVAIILSLLAIGLMVGSFLNVVAYRLPRGGSVTSPSRSVCPQCQMEIEWYDNVPLFSWLNLRGRCRHCGKLISVAYPLTELATAVLFAAVGLHRGWSEAMLPDLALVATAVAVTRTDLSHRIVPNKVILFALFLALPLQLVANPDDLIEFGLAAAGAFTFMLVAALAYPAGMGMGDVKLAAVLGIYLGSSVIPALGIAFLLGTLVGIVIIVRHGAEVGRKKGVPFAPFMAVGAVIAIFAGESLIDWYLDTFLTN